MSPELVSALLRSGSDDGLRSGATTVATMNRAIGSLSGPPDEDRDPFTLPSCF
jgi:hypothetical protein